MHLNYNYKRGSIAKIAIYDEKRFLVTFLTSYSFQNFNI